MAKERDEGTREQRKGAMVKREWGGKKGPGRRSPTSGCLIFCSASLCTYCRVNTVMRAKARSRERTKKPICTVWEHMCLCVFVEVSLLFSLICAVFGSAQTLECSERCFARRELAIFPALRCFANTHSPDGFTFTTYRQNWPLQTTTRSTPVNEALDEWPKQDCLNSSIRHQPILTHCSVQH